jgi:hypothetical protein
MGRRQHGNIRFGEQKQPPRTAVNIHACQPIGLSQTPNVGVQPQGNADIVKFPVKRRLNADMMREVVSTRGENEQPFLL